MKSQIELYSEANEAKSAADSLRAEYRATYLGEDGTPKALDAGAEKERASAVEAIEAAERSVNALLAAAKLAPKGEEQAKHEAKQADQNPFLRYLARGWDGVGATERKDYASAEGAGADYFCPTREQMVSLSDLGDGVRATFTSPARTDLPEGVFPVITEMDVTRTLRWFGGTKQMASYRSVENGNLRIVPRLSSHTQQGRRLTAEGTAATNTDLPNYSGVEVKPFTYSSDLMAFSLESLQDSVNDIARDVMIELPRRLGRIQNAEFTTTASAGAANTKPQGIVSAAGGSVDASATLVWDDFEKVIDNIDHAYLMGRESDEGKGYNVGVQGKVCWMMHQSVWSAVRRLQDTTRRPLLLAEAQSGISGMLPNMLLGFPVIINNAMPTASTTASGTVLALFGDGGQFRVTEVGGSFGVLRLYGDTYAASNRVAYVAFHRATANLVGPGEALTTLDRP